MVQKVIFTKTADKAFYEIAIFLEKNFSLLVAEKFAEKVDTKIERLIKQPYLVVLLVKQKQLEKLLSSDMFK